MANEFKSFLKFIRETIGRCPEEFADSFQDVYIYVPSGKIPPKANDSSLKDSVSITDHFSIRNNDFRKLVYCKEWHLLENHLGSNLLRFCLNECIFAKRTKAGAFMISNLSNLRNKITTKPPERLHEIFHETATCRKGNSSSADGYSTVGSKHNKSETITDELQNSFDSLFCSTEMEISTDDMLYKISSSLKFPSNHILVKKNTRTTMSSQVMNTKVGYSKVVGYAKCLEPLEAVLQKLKKAHNRYGYEYALDELLSVNGKEGRNFENQLPLPVLKTFFRNIFQTLIPRELFRSNKNINTVLKIIGDLLDAPKFQSINLKSYMKKMTVSDICWLESVDNMNAKWFILGKLLKWFFDKYVLTIFRCMFYIMVTNSYEKFYFKQRDWRTMTSQFVRKMREEKIIANTKGLDSEASCDGTWTLFPKKDGMRPITSSIKEKKSGTMTKIALCYLQQLYMTKYGESGKLVFFNKWKKLVEQFRSEKNKTVYLVSCDIECAYGSIDQKKLLRIVESLAKSTGPVLRLKYYKVARDFRAVKSGWYKLKKCVVYPDLEMPIPSESIFASSSDNVIKVSKELLLRVIHQNIRNQNILISNQKFLLQKGIAQGAILSSVLCDLYYAHMEETILSKFKDQGLLHRYVDDFLFATENKDLAERFLEHVNKGFPEYNCSFNTTKTRTNLPGHQHSKSDIRYLGFNINPKTLEVTPEYTKSARYTTMLLRPQSNVMATFHRRLLNLASLKLDGIILDYKINSEETIVDNIKRTFMRQAERCLWLLKALFDDIPNRLSEIYAIMRSANRQIFIRVQRYFLANGYDFTKLELQLAVIPWVAYRQVFGKQPTIHAHFRSLFLENKKLSLQAVADCYSEGNI